MLQKAKCLEKRAFLITFPYFAEKNYVRGWEVNFPVDSKDEIRICKLLPQVCVI